MQLSAISTDETLRETVRHGTQQYPFQYYLEDIWAYDFHCIGWHWHHELEMVYVREGTATCCIGTQRFMLPAGCGLVVNSGILHRFEAEGSTIIPNIVFSPALLAPEDSLLYAKYIRPVLTSDEAFWVLSDETPWASRALQLLREVLIMQEGTEVSELATVTGLMTLWQILFDRWASAPHQSGTQGLNLSQARLMHMLQFIHDYYMQPLTLQDIADAADIGKSSALHIFQAGIQLSPVAYLIQYRLSQAAHLLCHTAETVTAISEKTGFANAGYFCRIFRRHYGITPNEYRRKRAAHHLPEKDAMA